jgi:hypothetical protein
MATSVIPELIDALFAAATEALTGIRVSDGQGVTGDPGDYLMIGVDDPDNASPSAATSAQRWAHVGRTTRDEEGDIHCLALAWNGDTDAKAARDAAFAIAAALEDLLRNDPTLGVAGVWSTGYGETTDFKQGQTDTGAEALVHFTVHFRARL